MYVRMNEVPCFNLRIAIGGEEGIGNRYYSERLFQISR